MKPHMVTGRRRRASDEKKAEMCLLNIVLVWPPALRKVHYMQEDTFGVNYISAKSVKASIQSHAETFIPQNACLRPQKIAYYAISCQESMYPTKGNLAAKSNIPADGVPVCDTCDRCDRSLHTTKL